MRLLCTLITWVSIALLGSSLSAQSTRHLSGATSKVHTVSAPYGTEYEIIVTLPSSYSEDSSYHALYYLDAYWLEEIVLGSYRITSEMNHVPSMILVGIRSVGDKAAWDTQRNKDFTPSPFKEKVGVSWNIGEVKLDSMSTGGADVFTEFLRETVIPLAENAYNASAENRTIIGHSFGGLYAYYLSQRHSSLYSNYIIISPSLWWNNSEPVAWQDDHLDEHDIYMTYGDAELGMMKRPIERAA